MTEFINQVQFPKVKDAKPIRKTMSVSNQKSTSERSQLGIKDYLQQNVNGQLNTSKELKQIHEISNQIKQDKFQLLKMCQRPQYNLLSPYVEHLARQQQQRQGINGQITQNERNNWFSLQEQEQYGSILQQRPSKQQLKFKSSMVQAQIQKQKQNRKLIQYSEDDSVVMNDNHQLNFKSQSSKKLITECQAQILEQSKQQERTRRPKLNDTEDSLQFEEKQKDAVRLRTIDARGNDPDKKMHDQLKKETMNIIRQKTNYGSLRKPYDRAFSVIDNNKNNSKLIEAESQIIKKQDEGEVTLKEIKRRNRDYQSHQRNTMSRDNVSKSTQMQSIQSMLQGEKEAKAQHQSLMNDSDNHLSVSLLPRPQQQIGAVALSLSSRVKYLSFKPYLETMDDPEIPLIDKGYYFKFYNPQTDIKLIRYTLEDNGFIELSNNSHVSKSFSQQTIYSTNSKSANKKDSWTIMWSCQIMKSNVFQSMSKYQKVNHFPKSFELTRKDFMNERIERMVAIHGKRHFNFTPKTYVLPKELEQLQNEMDEYRRQWWIIKPSASAQGKGIYITNDFRDIQAKQSLVASHYIDNPLLINNLKFDLRIYIAITSINPLRIYMYDEGLTRFATCKYEQLQSETKTN